MKYDRMMKPRHEIKREMAGTYGNVEMNRLIY